MAEIELVKRVKYAGDIHKKLVELGWDLDTAALFCDDLPDADVAPVRRGHWLTWGEMFPGEKPKKKNNLGVFCNRCKNHADNWSDYCPNCGAEMD